MGLKNSKADGIMKKRLDSQDVDSKSGEENCEEGDTDDESEILEILQEGDIFEEETEHEVQEGMSDPEKSCKKGKSYHKKYILIKDLSLSHLKEAIRHESVLEYVQLRAKLVVKISIKYTSKARSPDEPFAEFRGKHNLRVATGYAWIHCRDQKAIECPNPSCAENQKPHDVYPGILITTNQHAVFNKEEAEETTIEFFYDGDDEDCKKKIVKGRGISLLEEMERKDYISLKIYCHDASLFHLINEVNEKIMKTWEKIPDDIKVSLQKHAIVVSHPHGQSKRVSIGELCEFEVPEEGYNRKVTRYTSQTCSGSSGAPVLTGLYWTKPFVHSSTKKDNKKKEYVGLSFTY